MNTLDQKIEKAYFSIGEVAEILELKPYVLRYWESEFDEINPMKNNAGTRRYKREDIEVLLKIKKLLHEQRFTVDGARNFLKNEDKILSYNQNSSSSMEKNIEALKSIQSRVEALLAHLD